MATDEWQAPSSETLADDQLADLVCQLFSRCSHGRQVELLEERLPRFLKRDFVSLLPPEVVRHVLRFLGVRDVFRCLLVSRSWHDVITDCQPFWKNYVKTLGVFPSSLSVLLERYVSYKALAVALLRVRRSISTAKPFFRHYSNKTREPPKATITCHPALPIWNRLFICHEVYSSSDVGTYTLSIRTLDLSSSLVELTSMTVSHLFVIIWSCASAKHVLIHGSDGSWIQTRILSRETCDVSSSRWGDTVYGRAYYELGCCPECCLVVIARRVPRDDKWWDLLVCQLVEGREEPHKLSTSFPFLPFESHYNSVFFRIHKVVMTPYPSDRGEGKFCSRHKLLIQFGATICVFSLHIELDEDGRETVAVQNLSCLCPFGDSSYYCMPSVLGHEFCLSSDCKFAAYPVDGSIVAWDLETSESTWSRAQIPPNSDVIAVGSLFSVVYTSSAHVLRVVSTVSGETLFVHCISKEDNPVYGPKDQLWLNDVSVLDEGFPLAITLQEWKNPGVWLLKDTHTH